ncbi:ABC transporter ATP-binding protein [Nonomuraea soli]|uniref:Putative ABC transport system ATP-binding protein n=1 Tax=Nonomuraea soli TaxID=1032476 RepID=A0A7W0CKF3_9ACTN|nr:ATP-binding cassette domain-containing protein [Nonomuraea soli]MBA2892595.1 putative ABC transport system ATP-binding protein [Nonomuraea soli]
MLEGRSLIKSYGRTTALSGVSLRLEAGEIVTLDGRRIDTLGEAELTRLRRESFGVIFQFGELVPELTALENVALPLMFNGHGRNDALGVAAGWLDRLEQTELGGRRPSELSGGQIQQVALTRALVTGPRIVFADEPTGALDTLAGERVMRLLTDTARASRTAVLIVTHDNRVAAYADREIALRDGVVLAGSAR